MHSPIPPGPAVDAADEPATSRRGRRRKNGGLFKTCRCPKSAWPKCSHPWRFALAFNGHRYRMPLYKVAGKGPTDEITKSEAERLATRLRTEIWSGALAVTPEAEAALTFDEIETLFQQSRPNKGDAYRLKPVRDAVVPKPRGGTVRFGSLAMRSVTAADVEALRAYWLTRTPGVKQNRVGTNRMLAALRCLFNFAIRKGYVDSTPFKRFGVTVITLDSRAEAPRERRLDAGEEDRLLAVATGLIRDLLIALLETGCRRGELLSLQFSQIRWAENVILLPAEKTKTQRARVIPITATLRGVLERRQKGPDGQTLGPGCYAFGTETGERVGRVDQAWRATCAAAGITNLHLHDLRREFASRLLESGAHMALVRDWLGHTSLTMTSRYLATTAVGLQTARAQFEQHRALQA
jgi:integrase